MNKKTDPPLGGKGTSSPNTLEKDINEGIETLFQMIFSVIFKGFRGLGQLVKIVCRKPFYSIPIIAIVVGASYWFVSKGFHVWAIYASAEELLKPKALDWMYEYQIGSHLAAFLAFLLAPICIVLGYTMEDTREKYRTIFETIGLTNGKGDTPKLLKILKLDDNRESYLFDANGIGVSSFQDKKEEIETLFNRAVDTIKRGPKRKHVVIVLNKLEIPDFITYEEIETFLDLKSETFYLGFSSKGVLTQHIAMPHMILSGSTGAGKSVAFKQLLMSVISSPVLESKVKVSFMKNLLKRFKGSRKRKIEPPIEVIGVDLKGGLEFTDFKKAPNFKVVKSIQGAVKLLNDIEKEMMGRFEYLEKKGHKTIVPSRDKMNRIVIAFDEASVLFMDRQKSDPNYHLVMEARTKLDVICKLSRAASIHCILATQKLDRTIIPSSVSENVDGRLALKANSEQGSIRMLGSTDAYKLPETKGRAIWRYGNELVEVQVPFIEEEEIKRRCLELKDEFDNGKKTLVAPQLGITEKADSQKATNELLQAIHKD